MRRAHEACNMYHDEPDIFERQVASLYASNDLSNPLANDVLSSKKSNKFAQRPSKIKFKGIFLTFWWNSEHFFQLPGGAYNLPNDLISICPFSLFFQFFQRFSWFRSIKNFNFFSMIFLSFFIFVLKSSPNTLYNLLG